MFPGRVSVTCHPSACLEQVVLTRQTINSRAQGLEATDRGAPKSLEDFAEARVPVGPAGKCRAGNGEEGPPAYCGEDGAPLAPTRAVLRPPGAAAEQLPLAKHLPRLSPSHKPRDLILTPIPA